MLPSLNIAIILLILCTGGNRANHENAQDVKTSTSAGGGVVTTVEQIQT